MSEVWIKLIRNPEEHFQLMDKVYQKGIRLGSQIPRTRSPLEQLPEKEQTGLRVEPSKVDDRHLYVHVKSVLLGK